jgi:pyridoxal phosphate enzyme (YggS family)
MPAERVSIASNFARVRKRIARAAARAGRSPEEVTLVAITKAFPAAAIRAAWEAGARHFGENRVQEFEQKQPLVAALAATWHLVGHLQSNKARRAAHLFHTVDSLDSVSLARKLDAAVGEASAEPLGVMIEVRLVPEETKSGVEEAELYPVAEAVLALPHLRLRGLMAIPPYCEPAELIRPYFRRLRELRDALASRLGAEIPGLSMGMSHDFEIAVEEGASEVRVGTALFGPRAA